MWRVEALEASAQGSRSPVRVLNAQVRDGSSGQITLGNFIDRCAEYFAWSGFVVDQVFQDRLAEGMLRCYFFHGEVIGFCHQWPRGLLDINPSSPPPEPAQSVMEGPNVPDYQPLRELAEREWVPAMLKTLSLERSMLPVVWDADFLYGSPNAHGDDTFVLCEINVSAVWPFPPLGAPTVAANAMARSNERRYGKQTH